MDRFSRTQLAELSGVPARTIRYYHSFGVLPKPGRAGKEAVYTGEHVERLRAIAAMQARGLRLEAIREVFEADTTRETDWREVFDPRLPREDEIITDEQLSELLGDRRPEILDELLGQGYVVREGEGWRVPEPAMLTGALVLYDVGTDVALSGVLRKLIRSQIAVLADDIVQTFRDAAGTSYGGEGPSVDLDRFGDRLQAIAREVGGATLAEEIMRAARELDS
ncbi:MerR family transcriptional regulator [Nocardia yamanashiensis]|uniref:MerR family transcriptional regulator n=1 Tax=Nocardia yamanashiensis TaxID=209247 RepID=UPI001E2D7474|nr:MerR family transcriptional regulator [Nocardia yamanashiensis]UGT43608.1 MerR family transcriptional regulator [Nocardia yamanashiensis]